MNKPYVKQYNDKGEVIASITKDKPYLSEGPNRRQRREILQKDPFTRESRNFRLVVTRRSKHHAFIQEIFDKKTGKFKRIKHYEERPGTALGL